MGNANSQVGAIGSQRALSLAAQRAMLHEDQLGTVSHRAIAWLLSHDLPLNDVQAVRATDEIIGPDVAPIYRASVRAWVSGVVGRYERYFRRDGAWSFLGAEAILGDVALDLLWVNTSGCLEADELKTGTSPAGRIADSVAQARHQAKAAFASLGSTFRAVRLIVVTNPPLSAVVHPDGSTRPLFAPGDAG